jgi:hypothetical protein
MGMLCRLACLGWLLFVPGLARSDPGLGADGTELVLTTEDGRVRRSRNLVGETLEIGGVRIELESVETDPRAVGGRVWLHHFRVVQPDGGTAEYCEPGPDGRRLGFPLPDGLGGFELTCTSQAEGKCVRWGYRPWEEKPGGPPLRALHRACVHMTRADYGGDGASATRAGVRIDLYDRFDIQKPNRELEALEFEAAWGVDGALCVARTRDAELASLDALGRRYPRLAGRLGPLACNEAVARQDAGALLFTRSTRR